jgi:hypothetical protein
LQLIFASDGAPILKDFALYDVTRRALNSLDLCYSTSGDALIAEIISEYQGALMNAISAYQKDAMQEQTPIALLSRKTTQLLKAWSLFVREQYMNQTTTSAGSTALLAYEAGYSLAELAWSVSEATVVLECAQCDLEDNAEVQDIPENQDTYETQQGSQPTTEAQDDPRNQNILEKWMGIFTPSKVVKAQHYVTALSSAMDTIPRRHTADPPGRSDSLRPHRRKAEASAHRRSQ